MAGGRPRTISLTEDEMIALGQEMVDFVTQNEHIVYNLSDWYTIEKGYTYNEWKTFIQKQEFLPYYEKALRIVGRKYLAKESPIEPSLKQRWLRLYFRDIREQEDKTLDEDLQRKKDLETYKASLGNVSSVPAHQDQIDKDQIIMQLKHEIEKLNANKPQAE